MGTVAQVTDALKKFLKARGMTYAALGRRLNLSEGTIKRLFSTSSFTLRRLEQICEALEVDFYDVAKLARSQAATGARLSIVQEAALASNHRLLVIFHLLLNEWTINEMAERYQISKREILRLMHRLHELRLIELDLRTQCGFLPRATSNGGMTAPFARPIKSTWLVNSLIVRSGRGTRCYISTARNSALRQSRS